MAILNNNTLIGASGQSQSIGYQVSRSLRFNSADSAYLSRTPASAGNRKTWTWSGWVKRGKLGISATLFASRPTSSPLAIFYFSDQDYLRFDTNSNSFGSFQTNAVFRDCSAWYHIVFAADSTQSTDTNRLKLYVNGVQQTFASATYPSQNTDGQINTATLHGIGAINPSTYTDYFDGYLADIHFIDGSALTPSSFAETNATTGQWVPKLYSGSYGTNGFKLTFSDNSATTATTLGKDSAGSNNWTPNNLSVTAGAGNDSLTDTPTSYGTGNSGGDVRGNYCTWNPLDNAGTLANGNLDFSNSASSNQAVRSTFALPESGKWYAEFTTGTLTNGSSGVAFGFANSSASLTAGPSAVNRWTIYADAVGYIFANNSTLTSSLGTFAAGTVLQIAYDAATGKAWVGKNNTWYNSSGGTTGDPAAGTNQTFTLSGTQFLYTLCFANSGVLNAGQRPFAYTAPSGFKALCDTNLTAPVIAKPNTVFDVIRYTGNGSTQTIPNVNTVPTTLGFSPDLVWIKNRGAAVSHYIQDVVRGTYAYLSSNATGSENNLSGADWFSSFDSSGFTVKYSSTGYGASAGWNESSTAYVGWCWDAGTSTVTNGSGSISSQVRANVSSGFAVITGSTPSSNVNFTFGHNLGIAPSLVIYKHTAVSGNWQVYHRSGGGNNYNLNSTAGPANSGTWSGLDPTSTLITIPSTIVSANSSAFVCYAFSPVTGYSSFGSYTGNGSTDGPFVYTGFRPRWVMIKRTDTTASWNIFDAERSTYNALTSALFPNLSDSEATVSLYAQDFVANGWKIRSSQTQFNASGGTYIYAAFAEHPFQYARAR